ncbi:FG-GAP-like repeat-containing protein [Streptomyces sp. NPDC046931]|uniref:FG-GAP-like repeat-containing protein n=1 Tax=Streptomyces sp. NPDC046931 TaxID=3154806 RepID=UPI0034064E3B
MVRSVFAHRSRTRRTAVAAAVVAAALAAGPGPLLPSASAAPDAPRETVVPATYRSTYTSASLYNADVVNGPTGAGTRGVFHYLEGHGTQLVWTRYSDGRSFDAPAAPVGVITRGTSSDVLSYHYNDGRVALWNAPDGTTTTLRVPEGQALYGVYGSTAVTDQDITAADGTVTTVRHLLTAGPEGATRDVAVEGIPAGMTLMGPVGGDATGLVFAAKVDGALRMVAVDPDTGRVGSWTPALPNGYSLTRLSPEHLVVYRGSDSATALVFSRADLAAAPAEVPLDRDQSVGGRSVGLAVVGDWIVHRPGNGGQVTAVPLAGGPRLTLMASSLGGLSAAPDGTAVVIGRMGDDDWGIQHIQAGPDGKPAVTLVKPLPKPPSRIQGLSLDQGRLVEADPSSAGYRDSYGRTVAVTGTPEFGERSNYDGTDLLVGGCPAADVGCSQLHGLPDGRIAWVSRDSSGDRIRVAGPAPYSLWDRAVPAGGQITDASGQYLIYTTATEQSVLKVGNDGSAAVTRAPGAAALSGDTLWTAAATPGDVTAYDLTTRKTTETVTTGADCTPAELQALGRWLYWTCEGRAGVYDRMAKKSVPVPAGEAKLGDGYVVTHDKQAGTLTTVADGSPVSRVIGDLPDTGASQRDVRWTVDESGGNAAYVDDKEQVHLVPSGVPQQPLRLLGPAQNVSRVMPGAVDTATNTLTTVLLSKPASGWRLTVRSKRTGQVVDTQDAGTVTRGEFRVGWSGMDHRFASDVPLPTGSYDWTLSVTPADGAGQPLEVRGTVRLSNGSPLRHDHVGPSGLPDGIGDLLTLDSSGAFTFQRGTGKGSFSGKVSGKGWSTKAGAVPFGDLNKDGCNDVLVRMSDGSLRGYKVRCDEALTTSTPYTGLGTGWNAYDVLTSPGDLTGDGRPDLLGRKASTGDVYLFAAKSGGTLAAGKKIASAWKGYTRVVGAGDLNGDGFGDVLARDKAGTLWRYNGTGTGALRSRVKVFTNWGGSYNAIVGVGDITGDGRDDLVERDTAGNLYRTAGDGKGSFGSRTKIASGWQGYRGLF